MIPKGQDEDFKARLIESSLDCIKVLDVDGRLLSINESGKAALEIGDLAPLLDSSWIDFWQGEDRESAREAVTIARNGGIGRFIGFFATTQTKTPKWWDVLVSPILDANGKSKNLLAVSRDVTEWKRSDQLLHAIIDGTSAVTGNDFFKSLVQHLAKGLGVRYSFVTECIAKNRVRSLAFWNTDAFAANSEYDLNGTPCLVVIEGRTVHYERHLQGHFPADKDLVEMSAESYLGVPIRDSTRCIIGHLVIMDEKPMASDPLVLSVMETFASRAGAELERVRAFDSIHREKQESDERFRDLFEEAPIAYVHEGLNSLIIRANRAATNLLGIKPEEIAGIFGRDLVPDTPDAQRRLCEALATVGRGTETSGVLLELRRKDNGKPVWVQWWSKPDLSGKFTRTMFIDVTDRILMEQEQIRLEAQNAYLWEEIRSELNFGDIIGESPGVRKVKQQIQLVAPTDAAALITGESGTGKELVARAIHEGSLRKERPLIKVNCGAIPENLFESEFFGHARGAFTGALKDKPGRFELADGGTLFLDEIGELPLTMQAKLLRVLQEHEIERLGETRPRRVSVRIIAASNRDLKGEVEAGRFRQDLFYRLSVFPIEVPPLRQRRADIPLLASHFVRVTAKKMNQAPLRLTKAHAEQLASHDWPGNIRELQNAVEHAVILAHGGPLRFQFLTKATGRSTAVSERPAESTDILTREAWKRRELESIARALKQSGGKIFGPGGAAELLGMKPTTLASRIKALGLNRKPMA
jgi:PAS domain S-box-containing protein